MTLSLGSKLPRKEITMAGVLLAVVFFSMRSSHAGLVAAASRIFPAAQPSGDPFKEIPRIRLPELDTDTSVSRVPSTVAPRAFVCITGQLGRLELENKAEHLFRHWHDEFGVEFDVALVLSNTTYASVKRSGAPKQDFYNTQQVSDYLNAIPGVTVLNANPFFGSENPVLNDQYYSQRTAYTTQSDEQKLNRVQNHLRQFESLSMCHYHMDQSSRASGQYDIVHRVRDDSGYYQDVPFDELLDMTQRYPKTIVSSSCQKHGGINDRGSFVSPMAAYDYFHHPILHMYTQPLPTDVRSTEQFLMSTYGRTCHLLETHRFRLFRMWTEEGSTGVIPGTNFDNEGGESIRCISGLDRIGPRRTKPRCHVFSDNHEVCIESS